MGNRRPRKTCIESCYALGIRDLRAVIADAQRAAQLAGTQRPVPTRGRAARVRRADDGSSALASVSAVARGDGQGIVVAVSYMVRDDATLRTEIVEMVPLAQHLGGCRWLFRCRGCSRCVRTLYLPPHGARFACRRCHDLTWRSVQRPVEARFRDLCRALVHFTRDVSHPSLQRRLEAATAVELLVDQALGASSDRHATVATGEVAPS